MTFFLFYITLLSIIIPNDVLSICTKLDTTVQCDYSIQSGYFARENIINETVKIYFINLNSVDCTILDLNPLKNLQNV